MFDRIYKYSDPPPIILDGLKDTKVKNCEPISLSAKVSIGPSKTVPAVKW